MLFVLHNLLFFFVNYFCNLFKHVSHFGTCVFLFLFSVCFFNCFHVSFLHFAFVLHFTIPISVLIFLFMLCSCHLPFRATVLLGPITSCLMSLCLMYIGFLFYLIVFFLQFSFLTYSNRLYRLLQFLYITYILHKVIYSTNTD